MVRMSAAHPASLPETHTSLPRSRPPPHRAALPFGPRDCANSARIVTLQTCASCIDARWRRERYKSEKVRTIISSIHLSLPTHQARFLPPPSLASPASARIAPRTPSVRIHRAISDLIDDWSPLPSFLWIICARATCAVVDTNASGWWCVHVEEGNLAPYRATSAYFSFFSPTVDAPRPWNREVAVRMAWAAICARSGGVMKAGHASGFTSFLQGMEAAPG
ncbi:hypothetical protein B0H16DRAFT_1725916 [Mycena metata]|uniref:Uncharacterized protein n=1 Tax=Mycena metata TaxID=1033252 RepID=A0AAD7IP53_9AGAR|nr:hypothetical protein B0H16DRAFT_1725916 [Mycena metata]